MTPIQPQEVSDLDIQKFWLVVKRRWLPALSVCGVAFALTTLYVSVQKPTYEAEGKLLIKTDRTSSLTGLGEGIGQLESLNIQTSPLDTQAEIVRSVPIVQETIDALKLTDKQGVPLKPESLVKNLTAKGIRGTDILQISYKASNPRLASAVVNKIIELYIRNNLQTNRAEAVSAREFIARQIPETEASVRSADLALRRFKEDNKVVALTEEASAAVQTISGLESQITQARTKIADVEARSQELQGRLGLDPQNAIALVALTQSPGVQEVLTQLHETQAQLAIAQTRYQAEAPPVVTLNQRAAALDALLQERIRQVIGENQQIPVGNLQIGELQQTLVQQIVGAEVERQGLNKQLFTLVNAESAYVGRANTIPRLEQTQHELERKLQAAQATYEALLAKLQQVQVAENQNIGNVRVISRAIAPEDPVGDRKILILGAGGVAGILLALTAAFTLELIDKSVKTVKEAKELFGYTLLGVIPSVNPIKRNHLYSDGDEPIPQLIVRDDPQSPIGEAYQMLQANLKFLSSDKQLKTIVVTSSVAEEGKSEVSANLAATMAQVGHQVLLIDADMRRPLQHHLWGLAKMVGLSNVIVDKVALDKTIKKVAENLYVLPAGVLPPNSMALIDSKRMASLIETFSQTYDFVIFDAPCLAGTADAAVLGKMVDGILLVVHPGVVDSSSASAVKEFLAQTNQTVLGMVINGVDIKREPDSYFYYARQKSSRYPSSKALPDEVQKKMNGFRMS